MSLNAQTKEIEINLPKNGKIKTTKKVKFFGFDNDADDFDSSDDESKQLFKNQIRNVISQSDNKILHTIYIFFFKDKLQLNKQRIMRKPSAKYIRKFKLLRRSSTHKQK